MWAYVITGNKFVTNSALNPYLHTELLPYGYFYSKPKSTLPSKINTSNLGCEIILAYRCAIALHHYRKPVETIGMAVDYEKCLNAHLYDGASHIDNYIYGLVGV